MQDFIQNLIDSMYAAEGIGIASSQVGKNIRVCIIGKEAVPKIISTRDGSITTGHDLVLVNPTCERISKKTDRDTEGCLSVPYTFGKVKRSKDIAVHAMDRNGKPLVFEAHNFFARVIQHEIDHLNGILFVDKATDIYVVEPEEREAQLAKIRAARLQDV